MDKRSMITQLGLTPEQIYLSENIKLEPDYDEEQGAYDPIIEKREEILPNIQYDIEEQRRNFEQLYEDHEIKEEMVIGPTILLPLPNKYNDMVEVHRTDEKLSSAVEDNMQMLVPERDNKCCSLSGHENAPEAKPDENRQSKGLNTINSCKGQRILLQENLNKHVSNFKNDRDKNTDRIFESCNKLHDKENKLIFHSGSTEPSILCKGNKLHTRQLQTYTRSQDTKSVKLKNKVEEVKSRQNNNNCNKILRSRNKEKDTKTIPDNAVNKTITKVKQNKMLKSEHTTNKMQKETESESKDIFFKCDKCDKIFTLKANLHRHNTIYHDKKHIKHICETCGKEFLRKDYLNQHINSMHRQIKLYDCICGKRFTNRTNINKHIKRCKHSLNSSLTQKVLDESNKSQNRGLDEGNENVEKVATFKERECDPRRTFECECKKKYTNNYFYTHKHYFCNLVSEVKVVVCDCCNKSFPNKFNLKRHLKRVQQHAYVCDYCKMRFTQKIFLIQHIERHLGIRKYVQCHICDKQLTSADGLRKHLYWHEGRIYKCKFCQKVYHSSSGRVGHQKVCKRRPVKKSVPIRGEE